MAEYILSIDIGTSSSKAVLFDLAFNVVASVQKKYETNYPNTSWAEQAPEQWWDALKESSQEIINNSHVSASEIIAIGIDSFSTTVVPVDSHGLPLRPGLIWMDRRAMKQAHWIRDHFGEETFKISGNLSDAGNCAPKIMWIKQNEREIYNSTHMFLQANGYLVLRMTGEYSMDKSQAGLSQLCDIKTGEYSKLLLDAYGIDNTKLPPIYNCTDVVGHVDKKAAVLTGLKEGTPVIAGSMDNVAAGLGAGAFKDGEVFISGGTVTTNNVCIHEPRSNKKLHIYPHIIPETWIAAGSTDFGGGALSWFNEQILDKNDLSELSTLVASSEAKDHSMIFLPYMVGQRSPIWNDKTTGVMMGLKPTTTRREIARAIMEGTAYGSRHVIQILENEGVKISNIRITGGSANSGIWMQIFSDVLDKQIDLPGVVDLPPLGTAIAAAYGVGAITSFQEATEKIPVRNSFKPNIENTEYYQDMYELFCTVYTNLQNEFDSLNRIENQVKKNSK